MTTPVSFEFFPPNTPVGVEKLKTVVQELGALAPQYFSVTYGAGGSTRDKTLGAVMDIAAAGFEAAPHLSCVGSTRENIAEILATYRAQDIHRVVALRGDLPSGTATAGEFRYASELVSFIRETQGKDWHIEVAAYPEVHPQQRYAAKDMQHFADKMNAGADGAITQFFFNADAYFHFVDEARRLGVTQPIVPGIMPFHNYGRIAQFAQRDGIEIPRWVQMKMEGFMDDTASIRAFGLDVAAKLCERLIAGGAPGLHFYTLNQSALTLELCKRLGLDRQSPSPGLPR
ncbi:MULTISPECIES: methylenetetrahydrofolate reductase [NAD(P)H] [unclassified Roseateles]|uniref:methylenetetrahydrofolate reductase [NAD(P)H] n=1 Tax=unclassified Roseateles TaxID=2626991 RepID=UPI0007000639|nr:MULTISPECIES: methylenetetrahydrofolate reductase [NAD(P)H] [unclassified Roseateles]KQW51278.1 5,10-methylenetetrahydrofolate reductase [Pelomonas sp. Root405]KRA77510.1 5,10-methylenetetrahydrofolate reductase [Pelomonas sp. Root662]